MFHLKGNSENHLHRLDKIRFKIKKMVALKFINRVLTTQTSQLTDEKGRENPEEDIKESHDLLAFP